MSPAPGESTARANPGALLPTLGAMLAKGKRPKKPAEPPAEAYKWDKSGLKRVPRPRKG